MPRTIFAVSAYYLGFCHLYFFSNKMSIFCEYTLKNYMVEKTVRMSVIECQLRMELVLG
jgi:hypothetical protein